jgi:hypothetical protein
MGGSAKAPKQSDSQRKAEKLQMEMLKMQIRQAKLAELQGPPKIEPLKPPLPSPPPPGSTSADTLQAEEDERRRAAGRINTERGTLFARETGGYRSVLGGGSTLF